MIPCAGQPRAGGAGLLAPALGEAVALLVAERLRRRCGRCGPTRRGAGSSARLIRRGDAAGDDVDEVLQVPGGPALEGAVAVALVGGHHRVAVVPVELRLGVEPEEAAGALGDLGEDLGVGLAAVGAGVAEHDHGRARVELVGDLGQELEPDAAVVGVAGDVGDAALAGDPLGDDGEVALVLEDVGHLGDPLDEDEAAQFAERVVQGVQDREEEDAGRGDRGGDVAEDVDLRPPRALRLVFEPQRHAAGLQRGPHRPPHVDRRRLAVAALLLAQRRQPPLHLRDGAVDGGQVLGRVGRQGAVELGQGAGGGQGLGALDQVAFELAPQVALEAG